MRILLSFSLPLERLNRPKFSMNQMVDPEELVLSDSILLRTPTPQSKSSPATSMAVALLV